MTPIPARPSVKGLSTRTEVKDDWSFSTTAARRQPGGRCGREPWEVPYPLRLGPRSDGGERISGRVVRAWARDTWASLVAMTDERTGLTADNIDGPLANPNRSGYTSPTNIGGYLWSAIVARDLGLISRPECSGGSGQTLRTLPTWTTTSRAACTTTGTTRRTRGADHLADGRQHRLPVPVQRRQRLAGSRSDGGAERRPANAGWPTGSPTG